jgi:hypothetical protein
MKKLFLSLALALVSTFASAQVLYTMQYAQVVLTPAQILGLSNTAVSAQTLIPAQPPGYTAVPVSVATDLQYKGTAYATCTGNMNMQTMNGGVLTSTGLIMLSNASLTGSASFFQTAFVGLGNPASVYSGSSYVVVLGNATQCTAGNSPIAISVLYYIVPIS